VRRLFLVPTAPAVSLLRALRTQRLFLLVTLGLQADHLGFDDRLLCWLRLLHEIVVLQQ
jgi:hypothetical protein